MMFSKHPTSLITVLRQKIEVLELQSGATQSLDLPQEWFADLDVQDDKAMIDGLSEFFSQFKKNDRPLVILSPELTFATTLTDISPSSDERETFWQMVPFSDIAKVELLEAENQQTQLISANQVLVKVLSLALEKAGADAPIICPAVAWPNLALPLSEADQQTIATDLSCQKLSNFNRASAHTSDDTNDESPLIAKTVNVKLVGAITAVIIVLMVSGGVWWWRSHQAPVAEPAPSPTLEPSPSPSPSPMTPTIELSQVQIQVRNGSGVAGQANQVKVALEQAGLTQVTTGNASGSGQVGSLLKHHPDFPSSILDQIKSALSGTLTNLTTDSDANLLNTQLEITTGR